MGHSSRCFVTIANSARWVAITGEPPPGDLPTAENYARWGLPWFDYCDSDATAIAGAQRLGALRSVRQIDAATGQSGWPGTPGAAVRRVCRLASNPVRAVREAPG